MKTSKVNAFTLMEMTVAMLIAAIAIGITYTVFTLVIRNYSAYQDRSGQTAGLLRLDELLRKDFNRGRLVTKSDSGLLFYGDGLTARYEISPAAVIRSAGVVDTFSYPVSASQILFEGQAVEMKDGIAPGNLVDELRLVIRFTDDSLALHYHKTYSSEDLIQKKN